MTSIRAVHRFLPVGQGLFVTGSVEFWPPPPKRRRNIDLGEHSGPPPLGPYRWVYDCGSSTNKRLVTNGIESVKADCGDDRLDLLTLSHFQGQYARHETSFVYRGQHLEDEIRTIVGSLKRREK